MEEHLVLYSCFRKAPEKNILIVDFFGKLDNFCPDISRKNSATWQLVKPILYIRNRYFEQFYILVVLQELRTY